MVDVTLGVASVAAIGLGVAGLTLAWVRHSAPPPAQPSRPIPTSTLAPTSDPAGVGVPHVYGFSESVGASRLQAAGFQARSIFVCSSSVSRGNVRQVLTDDRDGVILDDQGGVTPAGSALARGTALLMKISTGVPCNLPAATSAPTTTPAPVITPTGTSSPVVTRSPSPKPTP